MTYSQADGNTAIELLRLLTHEWYSAENHTNTYIDGSTHEVMAEIETFLHELDSTFLQDVDLGDEDTPGYGHGI